jgi:predicted DNA-binding transcriptional regulator AlpA
MHTGTEKPVDLAHLPDDALLSRQQVAALSGFHPQTLKVWAAHGRGPRCFILEGRVRFRVAEVRRWMQLGEVA